MKEMIVIEREILTCIRCLMTWVFIFIHYIIQVYLQTSVLVQ